MIYYLEIKYHDKQHINCISLGETMNIKSNNLSLANQIEVSRSRTKSEKMK